MTNCKHEMVEYVGLTDRFMNCKLCGAKESELVELQLNHTDEIYANCIWGDFNWGDFNKTRDDYFERPAALKRCSEVKLEEPPTINCSPHLWDIYSQNFTNPINRVLADIGGKCEDYWWKVASTTYEDWHRKPLPRVKDMLLTGQAVVKLPEPEESKPPYVSLIVPEKMFHEIVMRALKGLQHYSYEVISDKILADLRDAHEQENE